MEYQINPLELKKVKRRSVIYYTCSFVFIFGWLFITSNVQNNGRNYSIVGDTIAGLVMLLIFSFGCYRILESISSKWLNYKIIISNGTIIREVYGKPIIYIEEKDIVGITKNTNGDLAIYTKDKGLAIPPMIENMAEIVADFEMNGFTITKTNATFFQKNSKILMAVYVILMLVSFTVVNKIVVVIISAVIIGVPMWLLIRVSKDRRPNPDKIKAVLFLLFIIFIAAINIYSKLF